MLTVAAKKYSPDMVYQIEEDRDLINQLKAWDIYQKASLEARVMYQLSHPNILGLVGIALHPFSLLVELAPEGDLRNCVERFKRAKVKLSRRTLQCTLIQVINHCWSYSHVCLDWQEKLIQSYAQEIDRYIYTAFKIYIYICTAFTIYIDIYMYSLQDIYIEGCTYIYLYIYIHSLQDIYIYVCVCVCVYSLQYADSFCFTHALHFDYDYCINIE